MPEISGHHRFLFLGKVTNTLTESELSELELLFRENIAAQHEYFSFVNELSANDVANHFERLNAPDFWVDVSEVQKNERKGSIIKLWVIRTAAAALIAGLALIVWQHFFTPSGSKNGAHLTKVNAPVQLQLASGKIIDLAVQKGNISENGIELKNHDSSLNYRNVAGTGAGMNIMTVPAGMNYNIILDDGSEIWMNSVTHLRFPSKFPSRQREVFIEGEAYVRVVKDHSRPFIVHLPNSDVQVTGTEFNVNTYQKNKVQVALVNGGINFTTKDSGVKVDIGKQATLENGTISQEVFESKKVLSWRAGLYYFDKNTLSQISEVLARWYGINSTVDDPALLSKRFVGILNKNEPVSVFLENMQIISKIHYSFDKDGVLHFR